jgi:hypothetical protein
MRFVFKGLIELHLSPETSDVTRRLSAGNSLLSYIQLQKSLKQHRDPPVNVLTNQRIPTASSEFNNQRTARLLHKDLPVNFHSISPNYYLCNAYPHTASVLALP